MATTSLKARYIFTVDGDPLLDGYLNLDGDSVLGATAAPASTQVTDLGDVAVMPRLVNAHTHLEFSRLTTPIAGDGPNFADWIRAVIASRLQRDGESNHALPEAISAGLDESHRGGSALLGEITTTTKHRAMLENSPLGGIRFLEVIGSSEARVVAQIARAREYLQRGMANGWQVGLSPHAPYTVSLDLFDAVIDLAVEFDVPVAMHLAESFDELELLSSHSGPLVDLLRSIEVWNPTAIPRGIDFAEYLRRLSRAPRALVVHGNYLGPSHWQFLAEHADCMSVVYCPRTHSYFRHGSYPLSEMLAAGVQVALGTDSRASNPDLSMLAEIAHVREKHSDVAAAEVLRTSTLGGSRALGLTTTSPWQNGYIQFGVDVDADPWQTMPTCLKSW